MIGHKLFVLEPLTLPLTLFIWNLHDYKDDFQALVINVDYNKFLKMQKGKKVIHDENFWNNWLIIARIMIPLMRLLHICDFDEKLALCYVYKRMHETYLGIKKLFKNMKHLYKPHTNIINDRWYRILCQNLYVAMYLLNLVF